MTATRGVVGVITRTKNRGLFLQRAISSVLSQSYANWRMIIVNDGGDRAEVDELVARHEPQFGGRVAVIHNPRSLGMEAAANVGIRHATTDYILIHDDDDTLEPGFLEATVGFLESEEGRAHRGVATKVNRVVEQVVDGHIVISRRELYRPEIEAIQLSAMSTRNLLSPISFVYHRDVHDDIGDYDETLPVLGDWEFYLRFLAEHDVHLLPAALANYHVRPTTTSGDYSNSVVAGHRDIQRYRARIKNRLLRADLERGTFGLGAMLSVTGPTDGETSAIAYSMQFIVKQLRYNDRREVVLYGTGGYASQLYDELSKHGIGVACVVDSNPLLWKSDSRFRGHPISSLEDAVTRGYQTYVAASITFADEMVAAIRTEAARQGHPVNICAP